MAGFVEWELEPAVAAGLERLGWTADDAAVRDLVPAVMRGGSVVAILPPAPGWAAPVLAAVLGRSLPEPGRVLVLAAPASLGEWALTAGALLDTTTKRVAVTREAGNAGIADSDLLIASPESALELLTRSALHPEQFRAIVFAWPEQWHADHAVTALLQDVSRDAQRVVLTAQRDQLDAVDGVIERYAWRAVVIGDAAAGASAGDAPHPTSVRTVPTSWGGRAATVAEVLATLDQERVTIWTADARDHQLIRHTLGCVRPGLSIVSRTVPDSGMVICYDPPSALQLARLSAKGEVLLLVPPGCERHVTRVAPARRPMAVHSAVRAVESRDAALRQEIGRAIEIGDSSGPFYALAPLFERHDPQTVAAALFGLWRAAANQAPTSTPTPGPRAITVPLPGGRDGGSAPTGSPTVAKIWIGAGKKDEATVADFVAVLVREVGVERSRIGRIELRDTFALVEVPATDAEAIVQRLSGITIRRRKLTARIDQGRGGGKPPRR